MPLDYSRYYSKPVNPATNVYDMMLQNEKTKQAQQALQQNQQRIGLEQQRVGLSERRVEMGEKDLESQLKQRQVELDGRKLENIKNQADFVYRLFKDVDDDRSYKSALNSARQLAERGVIDGNNLFGLQDYYDPEAVGDMLKTSRHLSRKPKDFDKLTIVDSKTGQFKRIQPRHKMDELKLGQGEMPFGEYATMKQMEYKREKDREKGGWGGMSLKDKLKELRANYKETVKAYEGSIGFSLDDETRKKLERAYDIDVDMVKAGGKPEAVDELIGELNEKSKTDMTSIVYGSEEYKKLLGQ